ncbi:MAG: RNA-binding transcriptional accessory protein [Spirochaetales bacterium]|nr:RNA-binding transcriptional accessory protein [Spirochaetales bacterium]
MTNDEMMKIVAQRTGLAERGVSAVLKMLDEGATVPFMARYRKEVTGNFDEVQIRLVRDTFAQVQDLEKRRQTIINSLQESGQGTLELLELVKKAATLPELEDLYLPYRPKRRTRASMALEKGLAPVADLLAQNREPTVEFLTALVNPERGVNSLEEALSGGQDIWAERFSETPRVRQKLREALSQAEFEIKATKKLRPEGEFRDLAGRTERWKALPGHRLLALLRAQDAGEISWKLDLPEVVVRREGVSTLGFLAPCASVQTAMADAWSRLLRPSLENELVKEAKQRADLEAVGIFSKNLAEILLAAPLGPQPVLALDPGIRTGCKVAVLSAQGELLDHAVIFPLAEMGRQNEARQALLTRVQKFEVKAIAVGNGTAGRETLDFCRELGLTIPIVSVSESGASVYSASELAREELPNCDVTVRGAVSIGRRLIDPLAELVKVDPAALGVGQYQHDIDQKLLNQHLEDTVISCVNRVGVDVNTASKALLTYVSGLNARLASAVVEYRAKKGPFRSRQELLQIKGWGPKVFEQAAAFLRVRGGIHPLDASAVHPESYPLAERIAQSLGVGLADLTGNPALTARVSYSDREWGVDQLTFSDVVSELARPGQDPRQDFEAVAFDPLVRRLEDLKEGMLLNGLVTNVTAFGAFVDVGVHQDGLVHVSQIANTFVRDPLEFVKPGQKVRVLVLAVDPQRQRISLTLRIP